MIGGAESIASAGDCSAATEVDSAYNSGAGAAAIWKEGSNWKSVRITAAIAAIAEEKRSAPTAKGARRGCTIAGVIRKLRGTRLRGRLRKALRVCCNS